MSHLIKLPNGDAIDPFMVTAIRYTIYENIGGTVIEPGVTVHMRGGFSIHMKRGTDTVALELRSEIIELINFETKIKNKKLPNRSRIH